MNYVIAHKSTDLLDTPVFHAGAAGNEEAVAMFTAEGTAERYIHAAGWKGEYEVGELNDFQVLCWLMKAYERGVRYLAVDPEWATQSAGQEQQAVEIKERLVAAAEALCRDLPLGDAT
jgi:hypothetical protein